MCDEPLKYVTMFNNYIYNICCPTTTWMCNEADKECFYYNTDIKNKKPICVKCYFCLFPIGLIKDIFCFPINCMSECCNNVEKISPEQYNECEVNNSKM
jgi:hypothetical protein|tara:strand:+ start:470 stop:766 length:297 start_codon:yes stop_codon:yes gene_type:complete